MVAHRTFLKNCWIIFCSMNILHFSYPYISWWTFGLFPFFTILNNCYEHLCINFYVEVCLSFFPEIFLFHFSWNLSTPKEWDPRSYGNSEFNHWGTCVCQNYHKQFRWKIKFLMIKFVNGINLWGIIHCFRVVLFNMKPLAT